MWIAERDFTGFPDFVCMPERPAGSSFEASLREAPCISRLCEDGCAGLDAGPSQFLGPAGGRRIEQPEGWRVTNDPPGWRQLVARFRAEGVGRVGIEARGG
ncbi:MAG: hypothetical protein P0Y66_09085 [Candidatus Kaistia colombiensis]|nr:MAG: hypothetical protein P0Y66_09085 [Kaistia sp.]